MSNLLKGILGLFLFFFIVVLCIITFIPSPLVISRIQSVKTSSVGIGRFFSDPKKIEIWISENSDKTAKVWNSMDSILDYDGTQFTLHVKKAVEERVDIKTSSLSLRSSILIIPITKDSCILQWKTVWPDSQNPFDKWVQYNRAKDLSRKMDEVLVKLSGALENTQTIYGIDIQEFKLTHTYFISHKFSSLQKPEIRTIYSEIGKLKSYCMIQGAIPADAPMLHMQPNPISGYDIMVGLPINKEIKGSEQFSLARMPLRGGMLRSTVKGGDKTIENGFLSMQLYLLDIQRGSPAIPFQELITNRLNQPDSSQWITRLNYPVI